jgi:hypothetical protein
MANRSIQQVAESTNLDYDVEKQDGESIKENETTPELEAIASHVTNHDMQPVSDPYREQGDEVYDKFSSHRKLIMTAVLSFCGFLAPISSTTVLSAVPEVAATYHTTGTIINVSNAMYLVFMGLSPVFWGPMGQVYGRRYVRKNYFLYDGFFDELACPITSVMFFLTRTFLTTTLYRHAFVLLSCFLSSL